MGGGYESMRDMGDLVLPQISVPSERMLPRQMSQMTKKNNALLNSKLRTTKNEATMDIKMEKFYKTEDPRDRTPPKLISKGERDDIVSNYFNDKKKFK